MRLSIFGRAGSWITGSILLLALCAPGDSALAQKPRAGQPCAECHQGITADHQRALTHADSLSCLTCHHVGMSNNPKTVAAKRNDVCKGCHTDLKPTHTRGRVGQPTCETCHDIHTDKALTKAGLPPQRCQGCHERPHALHGNETECSACHTLHGGKALRAVDPDVARKCASCHEDAHPSHAAMSKRTPACIRCHSLSADPKQAAAPHGVALSTQCASCHKNLPNTHAKVQKAPQCADCHSFSDDPKMPAAAVALSKRCASCHQDAYKSYLAGGHSKGMKGERPNPDLPNCVTCHKVHDRTGGAATTRVSATTQCISCHSNDKLAKKYDLPRYAGSSYVKDYHGATMQFAAQHPAGSGQPNVMTCSDCHGAHAVGWNDKKLVADVCIDCHEKGDVKLAGAWLGHGPPTLRAQPVIWLTRAFYYVMIPFVLGGLIILIAFQFIDQRRKGATIRSTLRKRFSHDHRHMVMVPRFNLRERIEHLGSMLTFILLTVTGLPQTRPNLGIAQDIIAFFGGIDSTRFIHRVAGFAFVGLMVMHAARAILNAMHQRTLPVMVPSVQDFKDTFETIKHFLWGTPRPKTGKFDFSEKFEYWGLLLGGTLMSVTGVALVFPELITQYLPGLFIALFRTMHGLEATFAVLVVALWHSYGVILRPEVFPLDTSIFTGKISLERLEEEHGLEYERLLPEHPEWQEHAEVEAEEEELVGT